MTATSPTPLGRVLLVTGPEEFLRERELVRLRAAVLAMDPEAEVSTLTGDQLSAAELAEASAPSLFSSTRFLAVQELENTPEAAFEALLEFVTTPPPDVGAVLLHSGGQKGSGLLTKLRKAGVEEVKVAKANERSCAEFATKEARACGGAIDPEAAHHLVEAIGVDLRGIAAAVSQLVSDFPKQRISTELVGRYFAGRADVKSYKIADYALNGQRERALEELRWALEIGVASVVITGSFASSLRTLARTKVGDTAGMPDWKLRGVRQQARGWQDGGIARAVQAVAAADADVKGAGSDPAYALERMVLTICDLRSR